MQALIALFNHLLNQHPTVRAKLAGFCGRRIALQVAPLTIAGVITPEGWLAQCNGTPEATIAIRPLAVVSAQWSKRIPEFSDLAFAGDMALAESVGQILSGLRWVPAEDLSRVVGDVLAHRIDRGTRALLALNDQVAWRVIDRWLEYWREESPLLPRKLDVEQYIQAVDQLRDDCERLDKRLNRLESQSSSPLNQGSRTEAGEQ